MNDTAVVYKSAYGGAKKYAQWLAAALDADLFELEKGMPAKLSQHSLIIYGGGLYARNINGFAGLKEIFKAYPQKRFILFTVGLTQTSGSEPVKSVIDHCFTPEMHAKVKAFHLRGGIDYDKLGFLHRMIMAVVVKSISRKKPDTVTEFERGITASYGKVVSYADEAALEPLLTYASSLISEI